MEKCYDPKNIVQTDDLEDEDCFPNADQFIDTKKDKLFHIGQSYEKEVAETIICKSCGGKQFNVGRADHYTAIRCVDCEWEVCIHEG